MKNGDTHRAYGTEHVPCQRRTLAVVSMNSS